MIAIKIPLPIFHPRRLKENGKLFNVFRGYKKLERIQKLVQQIFMKHYLNH